LAEHDAARAGGGSRQAKINTLTQWQAWKFGLGQCEEMSKLVRTQARGECIEDIFSVARLIRSARCDVDASSAPHAVADEVWRRLD
jgi:hypothetical protein